MANPARRRAGGDSVVAAGLQKVGCDISLWIDDLGNEDYTIDSFIPYLKQWFNKAGGKEELIDVRQFKEIHSSDNEHVDSAWEMLQNWLANDAYKTDDILKISKILPQKKEYSSDFVIGELKKHRPRRVMTPAMVWTCMLVLNQEKSSKPIITLGGYDEQTLWEAWRTCCGPQKMKVGHIYLSRLTQTTKQGEQTVHMSKKSMEWASKEDIENEFNMNKDGLNWTNLSSIIPWTINNCALRDYPPEIVPYVVRV